MSASDRQGVVGVLDLRLEHIDRELLAATNGRSLCAISRSAGSVPAAKHLEGRMAAILELRRALHAPDAADDVLDRLTATWQAALADVTGRDAGQDWLAYRAGGVDELVALREVLST